MWVWVCLWVCGCVSVVVKIVVCLCVWEFSGLGVRYQVCLRTTYLS